MQRAAYSLTHSIPALLAHNFFLMIMKHLQTLAVVMMTTAMVLAAPLFSTEGPKGTIDDNDFLKEQIYREAKRMHENTPVRKQVGSGGGTVSLFDTCDANDLHFSETWAALYRDEAVHWEATLQRMFKICHHFCIIQSQIY